MFSVYIKLDNRNLRTRPKLNIKGVSGCVAAIVFATYKVGYSLESYLWREVQINLVLCYTEGSTDG